MPAKRRSTAAGRPAARARTRSKAPPSRGFVGRDPSPVLDKYPPKDPGFGARTTAPTGSRPAPSAPAAPSPPVPAPAPPVPLIDLERPFDVDEFSQLLGESTIEVLVPREDLGEVLRRISDFMGFGIYVYRFSVRPEPNDQLKRFVVELQRVDYSAKDRDWTAFEEKGRSESPFGPGSTR